MSSAALRFLAPIHPDASHHDRAELLVVGRDVALVHSYEPSSPRLSRRRDAGFHLWIQALRLAPEGRSTAMVAVSTNGGSSYRRLPNLDRARHRGGVRLLAVGTKLIFVYGLEVGSRVTVLWRGERWSLLRP